MLLVSALSLSVSPPCLPVFFCAFLRGCVCVALSPNASHPEFLENDVGTWCAFVCGVVKGLVRARKGDSVRRALGCNLGLLVMLVRVSCARVCDVSKAQADFFSRNQRFRWCRLHSWSKPFLLILASWDAGVTKELASSSSDGPRLLVCVASCECFCALAWLIFQVVIPTPLSDAEIGAMWGAAVEGEESPTKRSRPGLVQSPDPLSAAWCTESKKHYSLRCMGASENWAYLILGSLKLPYTSNYSAFCSLCTKPT